jgi:methyl-accepting chemotaxis protein
VTVIGVGRLIVQRQDYENSIERSYQQEIAARVQLAEGTNPAAARATIAREEANREHLRDSISGDTRDTVILVGAGLIAGLLGALLLFVGLIQAMRRPLEALVGAAGRLAGGDRSARVEVGGVSEVATLGKAFNEMAA